MKVLDVDVLHQGIDDILVKLQSMNEQIQQVHKDVEGIISLKESFKGKGGQAIRSYYEQCHMPLLIFFEEFLMLYSETLQRTKQHLQALEPSYTGFIRQSFLESELEQGLQKADNVTRDLTDEANGIIQSVSDIILLPRLEDDEFALHVRQAKQQKQETIEKLNEFDQQQTQALTNVRHELGKMHQYVQKIQSMFKSGEINISNFKIEQLADVKVYQSIQAAIQSKGMSGSIKEVWEVLFGSNANLLSVQYQLRNQLRRLMPLQFLPLGNGIGTQPSSYIPQDTFYPFGYTVTPTNAYYTNDGKKVNITNLPHNNGFTDEEIEGIQKYLADLESGKVESNINDIRIESDDTIAYNIFPTPLGGGNPEFDQITKFLFDLLAGDVVTIVDPNSALMEKIYSAAMLLPPAKAAKAIKLLDHVKDVENVKHVTKGTDNSAPSYGKNSVPKGPYREVNGYPVKVKPGAQEKHIPNTPNYKQEIANGKNKSIFYGNNKTAQELLDKFAGKGELLKNGRERVDFGEPIGKYYDRNTGEYLETTKGLIHYGKDGAHIVPSRP